MNTVIYHIRIKVSFISPLKFHFILLIAHEFELINQHHTYIIFDFKRTDFHGYIVQSAFDANLFNGETYRFHLQPQLFLLLLSGEGETLQKSQIV